MKILVDKEKLEARIAELERFEGHPYNRGLIQENQFILQQGEEYNENEAIEFADFCGKNSMDYNSTLNQWKFHKENISWKSTQELFKLYKNEGKHK